MALEDTTITGGHLQPGTEAPPPLFWKLRVVYAGTVGVVKTEAKPVRGPAPLVIGRGSPTGAAGRRLLLEDSRVSRDHAHVRLERSRAVVEDLGSKNGTEVNGRRLAAGEACALVDGDVLRLGDSFLVVRHEAGTVDDAPSPSIVGVSQAACKLRSAIARCAMSDRMVLVLGATGTGKGVAATAIHALSHRPGKLVAVNCAAIPTTLAESMFFGVQKGAYTGAVEHPGYLGEAHQGTLFLDEIGELPPALQPKLLHALETQQATPLGSVRPVACNLRIVSATNRDLAAALRAGTFREDLYHRLASTVIQLPLLRERIEDVPLLAVHLGGEGFRPSPALVAAMLRYSWPGNVREVGNIVGRVETNGEAEVIATLSAQTGASKGAAPGAAPTSPRAWQAGDPVPTREDLISLLTRHRGNLSEIEREAGYSRRQFRRWTEQHGIDLDSYRNVEPD